MGSSNAAYGLILGALLAQGGAAMAACAPDTLEVRGPGGQQRFSVEVADDGAERAKGLMFRESMPASSGMLFVYEAPQRASFWMKNTLIPLDIIFIQPDGKVLSIARNARPHDLTPLASGGMVLGVLEIAGGRAAQLGILPGDRVLHRIFPK